MESCGSCSFTECIFKELKWRLKFPVDAELKEDLKAGCSKLYCLGFFPAFFLFSLTCLFRPQLHVWQHFSLKRYSFTLCWHGCSPKRTGNLLGKLIQLKIGKIVVCHWIIFWLNWSLMWFSELFMCLCQCGEWSSGSEDQEELWKKIGLFVGLHKKAVQDPDWSLSAVLLWRVTSGAKKDFKLLLFKICTLNMCYLQASNKITVTGSELFCDGFFYSMYGVGFLLCPHKQSVEMGFVQWCFKLC